MKRTTCGKIRTLVGAREILTTDRRHFGAVRAKQNWQVSLVP